MSRMKIFAGFRIVLAIWLAAVATDGLAIEIASPLPGTVVQVGDLVEIEFVDDRGIQAAMVAVRGRALIAAVDETFPLDLSFRVPNERGPIELFIIAERDDGDVETANVLLSVENPATVESLTVVPASIEARYGGQAVQLRVAGKLSDGSSADLTGARQGTTYTTDSGTDALVSISSDGLVSISSGQNHFSDDNIVISSGLLTAEVPVVVHDLFSEIDIFTDEAITAQVGMETAGDIEVRTISGPTPGEYKIGALFLPDFVSLDPALDESPNARRIVAFPTEADVGIHQATVFATYTPEEQLTEEVHPFMVAARKAITIEVVSIFTTTTLPQSGACGDPVTDEQTLHRQYRSTGALAAITTARDALFVLIAAVGTSSCELCVCDVDSSGRISATDALLVLKSVVGDDVRLSCPACGS